MSEEYNNLLLKSLPNHEGSLKIRLLTDDIIERMRIFLQGYYKQEYIDKEGDIKLQKIKVGEPKLNDAGIQYVMFWMESKFNQHNVLGNISEKQYYNYLKRSRIALARNLMIRRLDYALSLSDYTSILDVLMEQLELYLTQPISAGTRKSISVSHESREVSTINGEKPKKYGVF